MPETIPLPTDRILLDVGSDVAIRFKGHGSYQGESGALRALTRRAPGFSRAEYRATFGLLCRVYDRAVAAVQRHRAVEPASQSRIAAYEDIDFDACMGELETIAPGAAREAKRAILSWVIYWHYLR